MKQIYVNKIYDDNGVTHGAAGADKTAIKNIPIVFAEPYFKIITTLLSNPPAEGFHTIDRYCQYIVLTELNPLLGLSMKVSDFHNNLDAALDEYTELKGKEWSQQARDKIMKLFTEIKDNPTDIAEMIIEPII
jgi:hypothetical protein